MAEKEQTIYRKQTLERISSPEKLTDYLNVTNPGIWIILVIVILLLAGLFAWTSIGTLETKAEAAIVVEDHTAQVVTIAGEDLAAGMPLRISGQDYVIATVDKDEYGRTVGLAEVTLPDGTYTGTVIVEQVHPLDFLLMGK